MYSWNIFYRLLRFSSFVFLFIGFSMVLVLSLMLVPNSDLSSDPIFKSNGKSTHGDVDPICLKNLDLETVILCTLKHSPEYKSSRYDLEASMGRQRIAGYAFPSNPVVSAMTANRRIEEGRFPPTGSESVINGEVLFSQEIYIGGQRQAKMKVSNDEIATDLKRIQAIERITIAEAIRATILYQAASEELQAAEDFYKLSLALVNSSRKRFEVGMGNEMEVDLAEAEAMRNYSLLETASRKQKENLANLVVMMGIPFVDELKLDKEIRIFEIHPTDMEAFIRLAEKRRPDLEAIEYEIQFARSKVNLLERERIPNVTVSGFVQNDGFNERVFGARVSMPIQLWRDNSGEIQEAQANVKKSISQREVAEHTVRFEAIKAWNEWESWRKVWNRYPKETIRKSDENLAILKDAVASGHLSVRDAILSVRSMVEWKNNFYNAKAGYALACAEYLRAGGEAYSQYLRTGKSI